MKARVFAKLTLGGAMAAGLLGATAFSIASAAPLGPQASLETDDGLVTHVKKGKGGGGKHHHHHWRHGVGGVILLGAGYCAVQVARCADIYGEDTSRYWRCLRRHGC